MTCTEKGNPQSNISRDSVVEQGFCCEKKVAMFVLTCRGITGPT